MSTQTGISTVAKFLLKELEKRFVYVLDPSSPTFDLAAALLNPAYRKLLTSTQKDTAKTFLKSMMSSSDNMIDTNEINTFTSIIQFQESEGNGPQHKECRHCNLSLYFVVKNLQNPRFIVFPVYFLLTSGVREHAF